MIFLSTIILAMFAGIFIYTGLNYLLYIRGYRGNYAFILFGWLCILSAAYAIASGISYHSPDLAFELDAIKYRYVLNRLITMILPWFIGAYCGYLPKIYLSTLSFLAFLAALLKLTLPVSFLYPHLQGLGYLHTPWREEITTVVCDNSPISYLLYTVYLGLFLFAFRAGLQVLRTGDKTRVIPLFLSYLFGLVAFIIDILVDANKIQNMYLENYAIFTFVLLVGAWLNARRMHAEGNYRTLFHTVSDAIFVHDGKTGKILDINETAASMFGSNRQDLIQGDFKRLSSEDPPYRIEDAMKRIRGATDAIPLVFEWISRRVDNGKLFHTEVALRRSDIDGRKVVMAVVRDIEARKKAEEERAAIEKQMLQAQKLESLGLLSGSVAHDFNNLLTSILGNAALVEKSLPGGSPALSQLENLASSAQRASALCRQLLAYSGKGSFITEPLSLQGAVEDITRILEVSTPKNIRLNLSFDPVLPAILADATQVRQVVMNLVTNAIEAIGTNPGEINLSASVHPYSPEELKGFLTSPHFSEGPFVSLAVSDNGCGMDSPTISRIFEPFFSTKFTGRGLGMAAVLGIIKGHGGAIRIQSEPGRGTQITVLFPATSQKPAAPLLTQSPAGDVQPTRAKLLLVDDDKSVLMTVESITELIGFDSLSAESGREALVLFKKRHGEISCVLLDLTMPDLDGAQTLAELRAIDPSVPIILTSGYSEHNSKERINQLSIAGFLQKPYTIEEFEQLIKSVIRPKKS
jgi:PAS domain S-box-containing protein